MFSAIREDDGLPQAFAACHAAVHQAFDHLKILDPETGDHALIAFVLAELQGKPSWLAGIAALEQQQQPGGA